MSFDRRRFFGIKILKKKKGLQASIIRLLRRCESCNTRHLVAERQWERRRALTRSTWDAALVYDRSIDACSWRFERCSHEMGVNSAIGGLFIKVFLAELLGFTRVVLNEIVPPRCDEHRLTHNFYAIFTNLMLISFLVITC